MQQQVPASNYLLPQAKSIESGEGNLRLHLGSAYCLDPPFDSFGPLLEEQLGLNEGCEDLYFTGGDENLGNEGYQLKVTKNQVVARAHTPNGMFHVIQTLRQLYLSTDATLPSCRIEDAPLYAWRSFMVDCKHHHFSQGELRKLIDVAAMHHLNFFHWHAASYDEKETENLVKFATTRFMTVVPEMDLADGLEQALKLLHMFPGPYVHLSGVLETAQSEKLRQAVAFFAEQGKQSIVWEDALSLGDLPRDVIIACKESTKKGVDAARLGHHVIICPSPLDWRNEDEEEEMGNPGKVTRYEEIATFDPSEGFGQEEKKLILGGQANLWTEHVHTGREAEYLLWPRLALFAERLWQPQNISTLRERISHEYRKLDKLDILSWRGMAK